MSRNEFDCLSNTVLQTGLRCELPVAFALPERLREMLQDVDVRDVRSVTLHQCPRPKGTMVDYTMEIFTEDGSRTANEFQGSGFDIEHDTYLLYDRGRDGVMKHLHLLH